MLWSARDCSVTASRAGPDKVRRAVITATRSSLGPGVLVCAPCRTWARLWLVLLRHTEMARRRATVRTQASGSSHWLTLDHCCQAWLNASWLQSWARVRSPVEA